jgi:glycosyltransferase involved in cell wall biosynthesis
LRESWKKRLFFPLFLVGQLYENRVLSNASKFYALSKDEMDYLKKKGCNVVFRTMGIGDEYFEEMGKGHARKKLGMDDKDRMIFFLGRVDKMKGLGYLLEAIVKFRGDDNLKDVKLKIAGYGKEREELEKFAKDNNLDNVEFLGGIFGHEKLLYLSACDLLVLPSLKEGAPVTVMEAMARNRPSVVSDVGGVRMMIEDGKNGRVIKKASVNGIVEGIREVLKWKTRDVRKYANIYKWEKIIENTVKDYRS